MPVPRLLAAAVVLVSATVALTGCGAGPRRTALAVQDAHWVGPGRLAVRFECAEAITVDVEPGAGDGGVPLVTAWGEPTVGRCRPQVEFAVDPATTAIDDATTGMVIALPPRP